MPEPKEPLKFTKFDRGKTLGFTWKWDHEPTDETRVRLLFQTHSRQGDATHPTPRGILEKLGSEKDKGRTHGRLDLLSREAPRPRLA